jgi:hypothetical protein
VDGARTALLRIHAPRSPGLLAVREVEAVDDAEVVADADADRQPGRAVSQVSRRKPAGEPLDASVWSAFGDVDGGDTWAAAGC